MMVPYIYNLEKRHRKELAATMQVRISSYENRIPQGTVLFLLDKMEVPFCGLDQMCLIIEEYLDQESMFEERLEYRYIEESVFDGGWLAGTDGGNQSRDEAASFSTFAREYPLKFAIRVQGRSNRSLQGELRVEQKKSYFRSGMELVRLMHQWLQLKCEASGKKGGVHKKTRRICNI